MRRPRSVAPRQSKLAPANSPWTMAASATFHANGPATSRVAANGTAPAIGTAPKLGLKPTTPHAAAGKRIDPPVSPPIAAGTSDAAPATPGPLDAPPGSRVRLHGLRAREGWLVGRSADREFPAMQLADDDRTLDRIHASHGCHSGAVADGVAAGACTHAGAGRVERRQGGGEKRQIARGVARRRREPEILPRGLAAPVGIVALQDHRAAGLPRRGAIRARADRRLAAVEIGVGLHAVLPGDDEDVGEVGRQQRRRAIGDQAHCQRIDDDHVFDLPDIDRVGIRIAGDRIDVRDRELHFLGGEVGPVVELDAGAELLLPGRVVDDTSGQREAGCELHVLIARRQGFVDVAHRGRIDSHEVPLRVERVGLALDADVGPLSTRANGECRELKWRRAGGSLRRA